MECEDEMYTLKKGQFTKTWRSVTLKEIISFIYKGKADVMDMRLSAFKIENASPAKVLQDLKSLGIYSYFYHKKEGDNFVPVLRSGFLYEFVNEKRHGYDFSKNVIQNDLVYQRKEDKKIKIQVIGFDKNNKQVKLELGDADGELRTLPFGNVSDPKELKRLGEAELMRFKQDGFTGGLESFGWPLAESGDTANIRDDKYGRSGNYLIDAVKVRFGTGGFRRSLELGIKI